MYKKSEKLKKNSISIVFAARNDNYGGDLIKRINAVVRNLIFLTNKYRSDFELIIVEYNPPSVEKRLYDVLKIKNNRHLRIRFIEVPTSLHKSFPNHEKIKLFEYSAKNIGIRRAKGDFIVATNQDIIFSDGFIKFLTYSKLDKNVYYRTDRIDVNLNSNAFDLNEDELLDYCRRQAYLVKTINGDKIINYFNSNSILAIVKDAIYKATSFDSKKIKLLQNGLHTFAAGDFLMIHKDNWNKIGGYDETKEGNNYLDSYILFVAYCLDIKQKIITEKMYHVDHLMGKIGRPSLAIDEIINKCNLMVKTKKPYNKLNSNWGLKNIQFKEVQSIL